MARSWHLVGSRWWWAVMICFYLLLTLAFGFKLGSIYTLAGLGALFHQWLAVRLGHPCPNREPPAQLLFALSSALVISVVIFVVFGLVNISLRTIDPGWRYFQLP